ncbi:hypothetical protein [Porticoccus sp.]
MSDEELIDCHKCGYTHREGYNCAAVSASGSNDLSHDKGICEWHEQGWEMQGNWETGCSNLFSMIEGTPEENKFKFCPYCGGDIDQHGWADNFDDL